MATQVVACGPCSRLCTVQQHGLARRVHGADVDHEGGHGDEAIVRTEDDHAEPLRADHVFNAAVPIDVTWIEGARSCLTFDICEQFDIYFFDICNS